MAGDGERGGRSVSVVEARRGTYREPDGGCCGGWGLVRIMPRDGWSVTEVTGCGDVVGCGI